MAYADVAFLGSVFLWLVNTFSSVIRGSGNMRVPSATLLLVAVAQVLVGGALGLGWGPFPRLGMAGVAAGQVVANAVGAVFLLAYLASGRARVQLRVRGTPLQWPLARDILRVGAVACLSPLQTVLTILILTRLVSHFGTDALAGYGIGTRLEFLLIPIAFAVGVASVPLVGMAIGAGKVARAREARMDRRVRSPRPCSACSGWWWRWPPTCGRCASRRTGRSSTRPRSTSTGPGRPTASSASG